jgi:pSer/pThr/pTyr-binding forkhead associated (FHA) protein
MAENDKATRLDKAIGKIRQLADWLRQDNAEPNFNQRAVAQPVAEAADVANNPRRVDPNEEAVIAVHTSVLEEARAINNRCKVLDDGMVFFVQTIYTEIPVRYSRQIAELRRMSLKTRKRMVQSWLVAAFEKHNIVFDRFECWHIGVMSEQGDVTSLDSNESDEFAQFYGLRMPQKTGNQTFGRGRILTDFDGPLDYYNEASVQARRITKLSMLGPEFHYMVIDEATGIERGSGQVLRYDCPIGREAPESGIQLGSFDKVSGKHALLEMDEQGGVLIRNVGSTNPTWLVDHSRKMTLIKKDQTQSLPEQGELLLGGNVGEPDCARIKFRIKRLAGMPGHQSAAKPTVAGTKQAAPGWQGTPTDMADSAPMDMGIAPAKVQIAIQLAPGNIRRVPIQSLPVVVGRSPDSQNPIAGLRIEDARTQVSNRHLEIRSIHNGIAQVQDFSTNGSYLQDGRRIHGATFELHVVQSDAEGGWVWLGYPEFTDKNIAIRLETL